MHAFRIFNKGIVWCRRTGFLFLAFLSAAPLALGSAAPLALGSADFYGEADHLPFISTAKAMLGATSEMHPLPAHDTDALVPLIAQSLANYDPRRTQAMLDFLSRYQRDASHSQSDDIPQKAIDVFQALSASTGLLATHITAVEGAFFSGFHQYTADGGHHVQIIHALAGIIDAADFQNITAFIHENELVHPPIDRGDIATIFANIRRAWNHYTITEMLDIINNHLDAGMVTATHIELWATPPHSDDEDDDVVYVMRPFTEEEEDEFGDAHLLDDYS